MGVGVEQSPEDTGEGEHVVDLVRLVRAAGRDDRRVPAGLRGVNLRVGVGQCEDDRVARHGRDVGADEDARCRHADEHIGVDEGVTQRPRDSVRVGVLADPPTVVVQIVAGPRDDAADVGHDDAAARGAGAGPQQQAQDGGSRRARPARHDPHGLQRLADHPQRVGECGEDDDRGAVLVVVEHRDVEQLTQPPFDLETAGCGDVFEIDAAEDRREQGHGPDDLIDVLGGQADRPGIDVGEPLEQCGLALHHGNCRGRTDVAQSENRRPVGDHRNAVALDREPTGVVGSVGDCQAYPGDTGCVGH